MYLYSGNSYLDLSCLHVMGILNITPDSFYDGGKYNKTVDALTYTNKMINHGATIIDIGGESTRPGANEVSIEQELERIIPIVEAIAKRFKIWISVNTSKPEVISESALAGAHMINDIRSLSKPGALQAAAETKLPICLMHMQGEPHNMQQAPHYKNILNEVNKYFIQQIERCELAGIKKNNLIIDPGFGFGKTIHNNYELLANLNKFHHFNLPVLVGMSRKSMIGQLLNNNPSQCLIGSISCAVIAAIQGANIIRVHDVKETIEAMCIVSMLRKAKGKSNEN
ncbi:dihydropteroate synthase [Pantoea sp. Aalb]|uniref:dihydropteroate synthase n=1 Tax=Pantoea sp. Aalb TaxID=2576762 RepID=UPI001321A153|nr:dihydropteroate synthase [Pantoea sp. Aalb]MXP67831.1 dihydropteroate synthase [Pantoea sp. Aalb]